MRWTPDTFWNATWADFTDSVNAVIWHEKLKNGLMERPEPSEEEEQEIRALMEGMLDG